MSWCGCIRVVCFLLPAARIFLDLLRTRTHHVRMMVSHAHRRPDSFRLNFHNDASYLPYCTCTYHRAGKIPTSNAPPTPTARKAPHLGACHLEGAKMRSLCQLSTVVDAAQRRSEHTSNRSILPSCHQLLFSLPGIRTRAPVCVAFVFCLLRAFLLMLFTPFQPSDALSSSYMYICRE
jgi:hypothetical protein